ncbi:glutathione S-transferase 1-like [Episyrphus balteatus]|uniref:glutathione S-transferase 1-like n=1 Tax=Episyrphus balteatus TaxID=286459 RepID=UPI002484F612|nr:glutathione S-transferase 1-like [Episyrphus balteatus]
MSPKPILYYAARSPPCRAVLLAAAEIGIELDLRPMNLAGGEHKTPEFLKLNPQHTIPVLDDNGVVITDSHVICAYLADKYSKNDNLFPKELVARNNVMTRLYYDCGHLFPRLRMAVEPVFYFGKKGIPLETIEYITKAYDGLEFCLTGQPFVCGQHMTIADLCCIASMSTAHDLAPIDKKTFPNLFAWMERMSALPYYEKCNGEGARLLKEALDQRLEANNK